MENNLNLFKEINSGNKQAIKSFILSTRMYAISIARSIVGDDKKAIKLVEEAYNEIIFNEKFKDNKDYLECLNLTIRELAKKYVDDIEIKDIDKVDSDIKLEDIDVSEYKNYYNNPKVEKIICDTINALPKEEKQIIIRSYFGGETIDDLARDYNVSKETIESYINRANKLIEEKSKPLFVKYKIETANYKNVAIVYSAIKNIVSFATLDVLGITVDKLKDLTEQDKDEEDEKDLKSFVSDILKDLVEDWFLDRIKSIFAFSTLSAETTAGEVITSSTIKTGTAAAATKAAIGKGVTSIVTKKIIIGVTAAAIATTGGVVAYKSLNNKQETKQPIVETQTVSNFVAETVISSLPVSVEFYSENEDDNIDSIVGTVAIPTNNFKEADMKKIELASKVISGLDLSHEIEGEYAIIEVVVDKDKINTKLLDFVKSLGILDDSTIEQMQAMLTMNSQELNKYLSEIGFTCTNN